MAPFRYKKNVNIRRVVSKIVVVVISLWIGGTIVDAVGETMNGTMSAFYPGLSLLGFTVGEYPMPNATHYYPVCAYTGTPTASAPGATTCLTDWNGTGILTVVGLVGLASVVLEFVTIRW